MSTIIHKIENQDPSVMKDINEKILHFASKDLYEASKDIEIEIDGETIKIKRSELASFAKMARNDGKKFKIIDEGKSVDTVASDARFVIDYYDKPKEERVLDMRVINKMKEKRNKIKKATKKLEYQQWIDKATKAYETKYNVRLSY